MKKVLYIALALVLALGLVIPLAGCGGVGGPAGSRVRALDNYQSPSGVDDPGPNNLIWSGQGATGGVLDEEQCEGEGGDCYVAPGDDYLLWIFSTDGGSAVVEEGEAPQLTLEGIGTYDYCKKNDGNSNFHFVTPYVKPDLSTLTAYVTFCVPEGKKDYEYGGGNWVLTISHGCPGGGPGPAETADVIFAQTGVSTDFTGTVLTVDGTDYDVTELPVTITKEVGEDIDFQYYSPLGVDAGKQYVWTTTTGLSTAQSGTITVPSDGGSVTGNYKTQYYLTLDSSPADVGTQTGEGWYDEGEDADISTDEFVDIVPGESRYRFDGWTTDDMDEIDDASATSASVLMDKAKTVTANYQRQYYLTVNTNPVEVLTLNPSAVSGEGWYDEGDTAIVDAVQNVDKAAGERYDFRSWTGATPTGTGNQAAVVMDGAKTATANYQLQYYLTLVTSPVVPATLTGAGWYDAGTSAGISTTSPVVNSPYTYFFAGWTTGDMAEITNQYALSTTVLMDKAKTVTANYARMILGAGGKTLGFWSNKNGQALFGADDLALMVSLNLRNGGGSHFNPTTYSQFRTWLLSATATNMAYMLSAQLAATELTVFNGLLSGSQLVWVDDGDGIVEPGEARSIDSIMTAANTELGTPTTRAYQEYLKNLLDKINNNKLWFIIP